MGSCERPAVPQEGNPAFTGNTFTYRQWNGTVTYDFVPVELQSFSVE